MIKDLPATIPHDRIMTFLLGFPHIKIKSKLILAKERIGGEEISPFINGDRLIYIKMFPPLLPKETVICGHPCRIWHKSQKKYCKRCASHGRRTSDIGMCGSYDPDSVVVAFRANNNPLSNYYMCTITDGKWQFRSAEHAYQWQKCNHTKRPDLTQRVYEAKYIAMTIKTDENATKWDNIKVMVMEYILHAKWNCCERFRQTLMATAGMTVAEATHDMFWGVGAAPNLVQQTKPDKFLEENQLGKVLHRIRTQVEQLTAINNSSHDSIVLDMPATPPPPRELLSTIDTSSSPPSSPVHVPPPPPLTQATTSLPPKISGCPTID